MILKTKAKEVNIVLRTRKIINITELLKGKNFEDIYFKSFNEMNLDSLAKVIFVFAEDESGMKAFKDYYEVYDFLDDYKEENNKSYKEIFEEIAKEVNDQGFFNTKMSQEELEKKIGNPISGIDMEEIMKKSTEKAVANIAEKEFKGYKG
ncbi:MAG: hypothetical protein Q4D02_01805 [Clostridia bacterium]|nr:hypothetical protein [Clostridia bacterium]